MLLLVPFNFCTHTSCKPTLFFNNDSPLGLVKNGPYGSPLDNFRHYRGVEVKHGRIAMAATLGMLVQQDPANRFAGALSPSGNLDFKDVPNGLAALNVVPLAGWVQMAVLIGLHEVFVKQREGKAPGDFGTGYFGVALDDQSAKQLRALNVEVSNGRLAMLGILGMFASEVIHGTTLSETQIFGG
jgi:light-harvesting complex I chlorophyll a/b binding protein 1